MEPWKEEEPPPGSIGYTMKGFHKPPTSKTVDAVFTTTEKPRSNCSICNAIGLPGNHPTILCYANPENP